MTKRSVFTLAVFLFAVAAVAYFASLFMPGEWYRGLAKPPWNPPSWLFGPVWTVLYLMIAIAGWRLWERGGLKGRILWIVQLVLNGLWSWLFFGLHRMDLALIEIAMLMAIVAQLILVAWKRDRISAWLLVPYLAWACFAASLNGAIWWLNR